MAVDGALRYEKTSADLLVAQALRDQPCDVRLTLSEHRITLAVRRRGSRDFSRIPKRQTDRVVTVQPFSGVHFRLEFRGA